MAAELFNAAEKGNSVECARLLEANADPDLQDEVSAHEMAEQIGNARLCADRCVWVQRGSTALILAAEEGHPEVCAQLLQAKANPDLQNEVSAQEMAEQIGDARLCADRSVWVQDGMTALMAAAEEGHLEVCTQLLEAKANPDLKNEVSAPKMAKHMAMRDFVLIVVSGCRTG